MSSNQQKQPSTSQQQQPSNKVGLESSLSGQEKKSRFLTMQDNLIGKTVAYCLNVKSILPALVMDEQSPIGSEKRLKLRGSFLTRNRVFGEDEEGDQAFAPENVRFEFKEHFQEFNLVRYFDPTILRDQQTREPVLDDLGKPIRIPLSFNNCLPGTWFFIDRYRFRLRFYRSEIINSNPITGIKRNSGHRSEKLEFYPSETGWYEDWANAWTEIQKQAQRGRVPGSYWDSESLTITIEEKEG